MIFTPFRYVGLLGGCSGRRVCLTCLKNHHGGVNGGHYTSFAKNCDNEKWFVHESTSGFDVANRPINRYHFDDTIAAEVNISKIKTNSAYVLFYRRRH